MDKQLFKKIMRIVGYAILSLIGIILLSVFSLLLGAIPGAYLDICFWNVCGYEATGNLGGLIGLCISIALTTYMWITRWERL
jgi:hypothetical protein